MFALFFFYYDNVGASPRRFMWQNHENSRGYESIRQVMDMARHYGVDSTWIGIPWSEDVIT